MSEGRIHHARLTTTDAGTATERVSGPVAAADLIPLLRRVRRKRCGPVHAALYAIADTVAAPDPDGATRPRRSDADGIWATPPRNQDSFKRLKCSSDMG